jgi:hydrogenase/urease accessory protein HupE
VGLQATITDVLARVQTLDGGYSTTLIRPSRPWIEIAAARGPLAVAGAYLSHGIEHILFGFDHLLFVLGLILIVRNTRMLLLTVTGFTVAHSITLSLATLGILHVPGPPVEACIALSILLLASEILRRQRGEPSLTTTWPWAIAFLFGLLHGLGFASALIDIGLPQGDVPIALLAFNIGVEVGQLAFIAAVLGVMQLAKQFRILDIVECRGPSRPMGSASWPRSGSLNGWQDFGHEDTAVTRNNRMRAQLGGLLPPAGQLSARVCILRATSG